MRRRDLRMKRRRGSQNEAREEEKCFIIQGDASYLSGVTEGIRGKH